MEHEGGIALNKKILHVAIGAASIVLGIICIFNVEMAAVLCGAGLLIYGFGSIIRWRERKKAGAASAWALAAGVFSAAFGGFIIIGDRFGIFATRLLLISLSIWLIAEAALEILGAVMYRKAMTTADLGVSAPGSVSSMVLGVVMAAVGVLGLIFPVVAEFFVWVWIVCELILSGIRLIWAARSVGILGASSE